MHDQSTSATSEQPSGVLLDRSLDSQLTTDGYVVIDLLDRDQVESLRAAWADIERDHAPVWDPTGMAATIRHPGLDWAAHARILEVVQEPVSRITEDRVCFMSTFLVKRPDSGVLPAHLDWRLVDEPTELTQGCWIALQDMDDEVGALGVLPGSHLLVDFDRTPESPGHEWTLDLVDRGAPTEVLRLRAGQAVVFDHRLAHFSERNTSALPRLAANLGLSSARLAEQACTRLLELMARGMNGDGSDPQIPDLELQRATTAPRESLDDAIVPGRPRRRIRRRWGGAT